MSKRIAIIGVGGIGGCIGAYLTRDGYDVTLIDQWAAHIDKIKNDGLKLTDLKGEFTVRPKALCLSEISNLNYQFDIVYLSVKLYDTRWLTYLIEPYLNPAGFLLPVQNGFPDELVGSIIGFTRTVGCVPLITSAVYHPGHVIRMDPMYKKCFMVGELSGLITRRVKEVVNSLAALGPSEAISNIWGARWNKFIINCMANGLSGIMGTNKALNKSREHMASLIRVATGCEAIRVAHSLGIDIEPVFGISSEDYINAITYEDIERLGEKSKAVQAQMLIYSPEQVKKLGVPVQSSLLQDVIRGRRTEVEFFNGYIVKKGKELNVPTTMNQAIVEILTKIERGEMKPEESNVELLAEYLVAWK